MTEKSKRGGSRLGAGRPKKKETSSISMRLDKEALDICRNYYEKNFSKIINEYVKKLAKKLANNA